MSEFTRLLLVILAFCLVLAGFIILFAYSIPMVTSQIGHNW